MSAFKIGSLLILRKLEVGLLSGGFCLPHIDLLAVNRVLV